MGFVYLLGLAFFVGATSAFHYDNAVGASDSVLLKYPSVVLFESLLVSGFWQHICSASILNSRYVLTAATCVSGSDYLPEHRRIRAGSAYRHTGGDIIYVEKAFNYPKGNSTDERTDDISVVRLARHLVYNPFIGRTSIPQAGSFIPSGIPVVQVGWGNVGRGLNTSLVFTANSTVCGVNVVAPQNSTAKILCGTHSGGFRNSNADVGGPWILGNVTIGVIAGINVRNNSWTGLVSASVTAYTSWIVRTAV